MLLVGLAFAGTLPTECPATIATGDDVAAYRAEVVVPAVLSVAERLPTLRADYGDATCPDATGAACTSTAGVGFQGTLEEGSWGDATADALVAAGVDGATVRADGAYEWWTGENDGYIETGLRWTGALAVEGAWQDLADDALEGFASILYTDIYDAVDVHTWDGTSGECSWTAESLVYGYDVGATVYGEVVVDGHTVTWAFSASRESTA